MASEHVDVLIVGAGLSGIGAACHLEAECPGKTYAILEARDAIGGTWDLFRYPGIRSDSDMYTLGYSFRPWTEAKAIADGPSIRDYIREPRRVRHRARRSASTTGSLRAEWSSDDARWTVDAERTDTGETRALTCGFLFTLHRLLPLRRGLHARLRRASSASRGEIVHPQHWPEDLDYAGKRVVVIGSGATAVTLVPGDGRAGRARHDAPALAELRRLAARPATRSPTACARVLPAKAAYAIVRWKNVLLDEVDLPRSAGAGPS